VKASLPSLHARLRKVRQWVEAEADEAKWRRIANMSTEQKCQVLRDMLPAVPLGHPARAIAARILARRDRQASR